MTPVLRPLSSCGLTCAAPLESRCNLRNRRVSPQEDTLSALGRLRTERNLRSTSKKIIYNRDLAALLLSLARRVLSMAAGPARRSGRTRRREDRRSNPVAEGSG